MRVLKVYINIIIVIVLCISSEGAKSNIREKAESLLTSAVSKTKEASRCVTSALGKGPKTKHFISDLRNAYAGVKFLLFTKFDQTEHILKFNEMETVKSSSFNKTKPTRMIIHGFRNDRQSPINRALKQSYLEQYDFQIIIVDWRWTTKTLCYFKTIERILPVGMVIAEFLDFLLSDDVEQWSKLKVIGHSLGAHVAGVTGKHVKKGRIGTIIGLDPAGPSINLYMPDFRLTSSDADYVECIHTNAENLGIIQPICNVDIYPNFGKQMPGCDESTFGQFDVVEDRCSHRRSWEYFNETLYSDFYANKCNSLNEEILKMIPCDGAKIRMGGECNETRKHDGIYYLQTNKMTPFNLNHERALKCSPELELAY